MTAQIVALNLAELTPTTLAAIIANLSQNLAEGTTDAPDATRQAMDAAQAQLVALWGAEDALALLHEAGADPDIILDFPDLDAAPADVDGHRAALADLAALLDTDQHLGR
jgi:hypothetical protein